MTEPIAAKLLEGKNLHAADLKVQLEKAQHENVSQFDAEDFVFAGASEGFGHQEKTETEFSNDGAKKSVVQSSAENMASNQETVQASAAPIAASEFPNKDFHEILPEQSAFKKKKDIFGNETVLENEALEEHKQMHAQSMEDQKQRLEEFKRKFVEQKKGMALMQNELLTAIEKEPDLTVDDYYQKIEPLIKRYDLSHDQQYIFKQGLRTYVEARKAIAAHLKDVTNEQGVIDGAKLFKKFFGSDPTGKIEVIQRSATIYLRIANLDDYIAASKGVHVSQVTDEMRKTADREEGCRLVNFKIKELADVITLENAADGKFEQPVNEATLKHEEQHVLNTLIMKNFNAEQFKNEKSKNKDQEKNKDNTTVENKAKDEILANFAEGRTPETIRELLLSSDTLYRYGFDYNKQGNTPNTTLAPEYVALVEKGISAYDKLLRCGYSQKDAQALLVVETLSQWPTIVEKIVGETEQKLAELQRKIVQVQGELELERRDYLKADYERNTALARVRKFFGKIGKDNQKSSYELDRDLAQYRAFYDQKLMELQELLVEHARERRATDEELAQLFTSFRSEQKIVLANEHDVIRAENMKGSSVGFVKDKMVSMTKWYQGLPLKNKLIFAATMAGAGVAAGMAGGAAATTVALAAMARRFFSGVVAGTGTTLALEAKGQMKDRAKVGQEHQQFLEALKNLSEEEKYNLLNDKIGNIAIKDSENAINAAKNQDIRQLAAGGAVATFVASGFAGKMFSSLTNTVREHFGWFKPADVMDKYPEVGTGKIAMDGATLNTPLTDAMEHPAGAPTNIVGGAIENASALKEASLTIVKGSSIEGSLNRYLETSHPEIKNHGEIAHKMYKAYMENYIEKHHDELAKSGRLAEYKEMLRSGRVNIQPGAELKVVEYNGKPILTEIKGDIKLLHGHVVRHTGMVGVPRDPGIGETKASLREMYKNALEDRADFDDNSFEVQKLVRLNNYAGTEVHGHGVTSAENSAGVQKLVRLNNHAGTEVHGHGSASIENSAPAPQAHLTPNSVPENMVAQASEPSTIPYNAEHDFRTLENEIQREDAINEFNYRYDNAAGEALRSGHRGPSDALFARMGALDNARKEIQRSLREMRAEDLPWAGDHSIQSLIDHGAGPKQILRACLNNLTEGHSNKLEYWNEIKNEPILNITNAKLNDDEHFMAVVKQFKDLKNVGVDAVPQKGETTAKWLARITKLALNKKQ